MAEFFDNIIKEVQTHCNNIDNFNKDLLTNIDQKNQEILSALGKTNQEILDNLVKLFGANKQPVVQSKKGFAAPKSYNPYSD